LPGRGERFALVVLTMSRSSTSVLAAAGRVYWSRANDAIGYEPSESFLERVQSLFGERVFRALTIGGRFDDVRNE
jgi:hypothetical protein